MRRFISVLAILVLTRQLGAQAAQQGKEKKHKKHKENAVAVVESKPAAQTPAVRAP